jgi:secondary thiamine-phosphate synthase enzyme
MSSPPFWGILSGMNVLTCSLHVRTKGHADVVDVTAELREAIANSGIASGIAALFVAGSTAALSTIECEPGAVADMKAVLDRLAPEDAPWQHHATWGDDNGASHVRACLLGPSLTVPIVDGSPILGTWQQVVLLDFDTRPRERAVVVQLMGN